MMLVPCSLDIGSTLPTSVKALSFLNCCSLRVPSSKISGRKMDPGCPRKKSNSQATSPCFCALVIQYLDTAIATVLASGVLPAPGSPWFTVEAHSVLCKARHHGGKCAQEAVVNAIQCQWPLLVDHSKDTIIG